MILSMSEQAATFALAVFSGALLGLVYDGLRVFRRVVPHGGVAIAIEDFIYWLIMAGFMFFLLLNRNFGEIRVFLFFGAALGALIYFLALSRHIIAAALWLINTTLRPILFAGRFVLSKISTAKKGLNKTHTYAKMRLQGICKKKAGKLWNQQKNLRKKSRAQGGS